ncbi:hypothetical protein GF325_14300 [Candidatus Bathyarchaeota archaeon]|nr:hypothetical protein [Candidatus Bathyarchaeota archaeon]
MLSQTFGIMFKVEVDGTIVPIEWSESHFNDENIIIILEEYNQLVWIYYGKQNGLVTKRKAYRQADSLRGHGYTVGNSIIGRNLSGIVEIDQRKIDRVPETTQEWEKMKKLFTLNHVKYSEECVALSEGDIPRVPERKPAPEPTPEPAPVSEPVAAPAPTPEPASPSPAVEPVPEPSLEPITPDPQTSNPPVESTPGGAPSNTTAGGEGIPIVDDYAGIEEGAFNHSQESLDGVDFITKADELKAGNLIMAILRYSSDVYASKKGNHFKVESLDGPICEFTIENGKIMFSKESFTEIPSNVKKNIQEAFVDLSQ